MKSLDLVKLFAALERFPGLQRKEWQLYQTGVDRGLEAVLIQRCTRELATYALVLLRLEVMPELCAVCNTVDQPLSEMQSLLRWARTQGAGGSILANVVEREGSYTPPSRRVLAALASLRFYHCRDDQNSLVKSPWTEQGFARLAALDVCTLLTYPTHGAFWRKKFDTVKRLVTYIRGEDFSAMDDDSVARSLQSIPGVGEQTASMVALFWLGRPVPIIDMYLLRLLHDHHLLPVSSSMTVEDKANLRRHILQGARDIEASRPEWSAARVLSCLYLWACEIGRFRYCRCETGASPCCPIRSVC